MNITKTIKLTTGVMCKHIEFNNDHQQILTKQDKADHMAKQNEILLDIVKELGDNIKVVKEQDILNLTDADRKLILLSSREFAVEGTEYAKSFDYTFEYERHGKILEHVYTIDLTEEIPIKPMMVQTETNVDGKIVYEAVEASYTEYSQVVKEFYTVLPRAGVKVKLSQLDGHGTLQAANEKRENISSHSVIMARKPVYFENKKGKELPIRFDLKKFKSIVDRKHLKSTIDTYEGSVGTVVKLKHPDTDEIMERDILQMIGFFYLGESI